MARQLKIPFLHTFSIITSRISERLRLIGTDNSERPRDFLEIFPVLISVMLITALDLIRERKIPPIS
jgi:hypothetical protein